jgi:hypothetical protein
MKNTAIIILAIGFLFLLNHINPEFDDHKSAISTEIKLDSPVWKNLTYKDFVVASFTTSASKGSMVSFGLCKYVKVVDDEWVLQQN